MKNAIWLAAICGLLVSCADENKLATKADLEAIEQQVSSSPSQPFKVETPALTFSQRETQCNTVINTIVVYKLLGELRSGAPDCEAALEMNLPPAAMYSDSVWLGTENLTPGKYIACVNISYGQLGFDADRYNRTSVHPFDYPASSSMTLKSTAPTVQDDSCYGGFWTIGN